MKRKIGKISIVVIIFSLIMICSPMPLQAAPVDDDQIEQAIEAGLVFLAEQQNTVDGYWDGSDRVGHTAFAVLKMEDRAIELGFDPFEEEYIYSENIKKGLNFIFSKAKVMDSKIYFYDTSSWHSVYETSVAMMAIAASNDPSRIVVVPSSLVNGLTYEEVEQGALEYLEYAQNADGGWGYYKDDLLDTTRSDNSNTGYAALGLIYAQNKFGLTISPGVKGLLSEWIDFIQNQPGPADDGWEIDPDGGSGYADPDQWVNILKTGNLLFEMAFVGDVSETARAKAAINYIERHWNDESMDPGWKGWYWWSPIDNDGDGLIDEDPVDGIDNDFDGLIDEDPQQPHYQAMYTTMKGLEAMGIDTIMVNGEKIDWFDEFCTAIVNTQSDDGSWPYDYWGDDILATEWALLTLEKVVEIPLIPVFVDIKPGSWPNPINPRSKGVIPVAICGTEEFDVTTIDPVTIQITTEDIMMMIVVSPLRWSYEDVATPYTGEEGGGHELTGDGIIDLVLHFDTQEVVENLGLYYYAGTTIHLLIKGNLYEEEGSTPIQGQDFVWILDKEKK